jgi:four helix bundle protein
MRPFRELRVWEESHQLTLDVYRATGSFPNDERFALTNQLRRAAYSVPFNIVEGTSRGDAECRQFLRIALGSAAELEYGLLLARDLGYLPKAEHESLTARTMSVKRMLNAFIARMTTTIESRANKPPVPDSHRPTANGQRPSMQEPAL